MADNLTHQQRSYCMSRVKGRDTGLERLVRSELHRRGLRFRKHVKELAGRPDIVFPRRRVVVFIDGDFWHGYRLPAWEKGLSEFWKRKIRGNRERDRKNFKKLRAADWRVVRLWQHQIEADLDGCVERIVEIVNTDLSGWSCILGYPETSCQVVGRGPTRAALEPPIWRMEETGRSLRGGRVTPVVISNK